MGLGTILYEIMSNKLITNRQHLAKEYVIEKSWDKRISSIIEQCWKIGDIIEEETVFKETILTILQDFISAFEKDELENMFKGVSNAISPFY